MSLVAHPPLRRKAGVWTRCRRRIQQLGTYPSLLLLFVPIATIEPLKIVALVVAGKGHWLFGAATIFAAYAISLLVTERLFRLVKPKLMMLDWFAAIWTKAASWRNSLLQEASRSNPVRKE